MVVTYEKKDKIAIITINRPEVMNALSIQVFREIYESTKDFLEDPQVFVGILTGAGERAFSAGRDMKESLKESLSGELQDPNRQQHKALRDLNIWKPLIAAINGYCLGGGMELALECDIRIAAEQARFGMPEVTRGRIPRGGGSQKLIRILPWCYAAEILFTGKHIDAQTAYRMGLVNEVVSKEQLMPRAMEWATQISQNAPLALKKLKEAMVRGRDMTMPQGLELEKKFFEDLSATEDFTEGSQSFVEQRKPIWRGK